MLGRILVPAALALGLALPAAADTIDVLRQNTLTFTRADGQVTTILLQEEKRLEQVNGLGVWAAGFWQMDAEDGFCWTARGEATVCINLPKDAGVGAEWDVTGPTGKSLGRAKIVAGRSDLKALSRRH